MINPLVNEAWHGLAHAGRGQKIYLNCLFIQAVVLFFWWPKATPFGPLSNETRPATLFALFIAIGATTAYYATQAGAQEDLSPGQHSLRDWVLNSPLKLRQILFGLSAASVIQSLHLIVLSSPLIIMAHAVNATTWHGLFWSLIAIIVQINFYRLIGAIVYMTIGHREQLSFLALRATLLGGYLVLGILVPLTSHWQLSHSLLRVDSGDRTDSAAHLLIGMPGFLLGFALLTGAALSLLYPILRGQRRKANWPTSVERIGAASPLADKK